MPGASHAHLEDRHPLEPRRAVTNLAQPVFEPCAIGPGDLPAFEAIPGRAADLGGLAIRRLLPRAKRRMVGPFCFFDSFGPLSFSSGKPMDVAPHPHIGLQTVSWLLEGEIEHHDSLGCEAVAGAGVLNLMTAGRGIAHSEETPAENSGRLRGVQLWVALPEEARWTEPSFERHSDLPSLEHEGGAATVILGELSGLRSPARRFSPSMLVELRLLSGSELTIPLRSDFEHALVVLRGDCGMDGGKALSMDTLYYLGRGRREIAVEGGPAPATALLLGGAPFAETIRMWWNFVARRPEEIMEAREDWVAGRRFGEVSAYRGARAEAPALAAP
jgi:redox-sensitive bicupin YhaK (pirin superfamily)